MDLMRLAMEDTEGDDGQTSNSIFPELKHHCVQLLELLQNPQKNPSAPSQLLLLLRESPPHALQPFFDYIVFPLLLLLDAAVECRSLSTHDGKERSVLSGAPEVFYKVGDFVAEGVINCLAELLFKCPVRSVDQVLQYDCCTEETDSRCIAFSVRGVRRIT